MRADRLLRILLTLQTQGRVTAESLAERMEVSARTIQRDMEALSAAGVPVYAIRGGGGGWELLAGYRTGLTGFTTDDAIAIMAGRPPKLLHELGVDIREDSAILKLLATLTPEARDLAARAQERILVDIAPWGTEPRQLEQLQLLQRAAWGDQIVRMRYAGKARPFRVEPYALVAKGVVWYLVGRTRSLRTYRVDRVAEVALTDDTFERTPDFKLESHWRNVCEGFASRLPEFLVHLRVRTPAVDRLRWSTRVLDIGDPDDAGWSEAVIDTESEPEATSIVLGLAPNVIVVSPATLAVSTRNAALAFAARASG